MERAASGNRIRISTVHPGIIDTAIWTKPLASTGTNAPIDPNEVTKTGGTGRQAQDIANRVLLLASDTSSYMTGAELVIEGGMTGGARSRWTELEGLRLSFSGIRKVELLASDIASTSTKRPATSTRPEAIGHRSAFVMTNPLPPPQ